MSDAIVAPQKIDEVASLEKRYLFNTYARLPLYIERGSGVTVWDPQGRSYVDMLGGIAVNALGYAHPRINRVVREQVERCIHTSNLFYHPYQADLAKRLVEISGLSKVFFTNSGAEAVEAAFKIARAYAKKKGHSNKFGIVALENSFHGRTAGALSATATEKYRKPFEPLLPNVRFAKANDLQDLAAALSESTSAVIMETIQGEGGIHPLTGSFLQAARELCNRYDALLVFDEIQCGMGRTGRYFRYQKFNVQPDLLTVAKSMAAGFPLGAVIGSEKVAEVFAPGDHGTTFGGGPLACRVALEFLKVIEEENLLEQVQQMGAYLVEKLEALKAQFHVIRAVRGEGLMVGVEFEDSAKSLVERLLQAGFITNCVHEKVIRLLPPYIIEKQHIDAFVSALQKILLTEEKS